MANREIRSGARSISASRLLLTNELQVRKVMDQSDRDRAELIGRLIRESRLQNHLSVDDCGQALGIEPDSYKLIEKGEVVLSLPDLEVLAMYFGVSVAYFWQGKVRERQNQVDFIGYLALRQAIIGTTLRQYRKEMETELGQLAEITGINGEKITAYESGHVVPFFDLEKILRALGHSVKDLNDDAHGPLAEHEENLVYRIGFENLTPKQKRFVSQPINQSYLETAIRLSKLDADKLRIIAEGILEITY